MCHFVDLARFLIGAPIVSVQAAAARAARAACDDLTASLSFADGSLATGAGGGGGGGGVGGELVEAYAGGTVITIDNFRALTVVSDGKAKKSGAGLDQDKGHADELAAFVAAVASGGPPPAPEAELVDSSLATIAILESLRTGAQIAL
jgi:predicted dehydrogenase